MGCNAACTDTHCAECPTNVGICSVCNPNYVVNNGGCVNKPNCKTVNADGDDCTSCLDGYLLASGSCSACSTGCKTCTAADDATACTACFDKYFYSSGSCTACDDTNCKICTATTADTCTACNDEFFLASGACTGNACATNCKNCVVADVCTVAKDGYYVSSDAPVVCPAALTHCAK